jgi:putative phosphoesterase
LDLGHWDLVIPFWSLELGHFTSPLHTAAVKLGLISDTHGTVPAAVHDALAGVYHILHAGDVGPVDIITELEAIAPVSAVRGNTDFAIDLPETRLIEFDGNKFLIHHIVDFPVPSQTVRALLAEEQPDVVVFGHTHMPYNELLNGVLYLNPGSPATPRGGAPASVAIVEFVNGAPRARHITLT